MAPGGDRTRGSGGSLPAWDAGGQEEDTPPLCQATLSPCRGREGPVWQGATRLTQHRRSDGRLHPIRSRTQGRSEGRRLGYLCLQQQHVEVGDRLSVDAQELQFTSQSICQLSNLKLPGEKAESRAALWEHHRAAVALRLSENIARDHPWCLSLEGLGRATLALSPPLLSPTTFCTSGTWQCGWLGDSSSTDCT